MYEHECACTHSFLHVCVGAFPVFLQQQQHVAPFFCRLHCWEWHCWGQSTNSVLYVCVSRPYSLTHTYAHMHMQYIACACACLFFFETTLNGSQPSLHTRTHTHTRVNTYKLSSVARQTPKRQTTTTTKLCND